FLDADVLALRDHVFPGAARLRIGRDDDDAALRLVVLAELHAAVDLADDREVLRPAGLEQLRHARQTAGDVAGLRRFARDARDHVAGPDRGAVLDAEDGVDRHEVAGLDAARQRQRLAL